MITLANPVNRVETQTMNATYEDARAVQEAHEESILRLPGVNGLMVKLADGRPVLEVYVDPDAEVPDELKAEALDGIPLAVERRRYETQ